MDPLQILDYTSILTTFVFFSLGSWFDLKTREVSDKVWLIYGPIGAALTVARLLLDSSSLILVLGSIGLTTLLSFALFYFGLFGGADAKAMICLGLTIPLFPGSYETLFGYMHPFLPVVVVVIGFVSSVSVAIWIGARNLPRVIGHRAELFRGLEHEPTWKKALAAITGYPCRISKLISTYYLYPMEDVAEEPDGARRRFRLFFSAETDRGQAVAKLESSLSKVGSPNEVWVSPGIPMLVFMLIGLVITLVLGDPIFSAIFLVVPR